MTRETSFAWGAEGEGRPADRTPDRAAIQSRQRRRSLADDDDVVPGLATTNEVKITKAPKPPRPRLPREVRAAMIGRSAQGRQLPMTVEEASEAADVARSAIQRILRLAEAKGYIVRRKGQIFAGPTAPPAAPAA